MNINPDCRASHNAQHGILIRTVMKIYQLYARLGKDTSTAQSLFTASFSEVNKISIQLSNVAAGTANFAIFENGEEKVSKKVRAGESIAFSPRSLENRVAFYINSYDAEDLPTAEVIIT